MLEMTIIKSQQDQFLVIISRKVRLQYAFASIEFRQCYDP